MEERFAVEDGDSITLGSSADCMIHIPGRDVGPHHAELTRSDGHWYIMDLGSPHGTIVNGERIADRPLESGDLITIGSTQFRVEGDEIVRAVRDGISQEALRLVPGTASLSFSAQQAPPPEFASHSEVPQSMSAAPPSKGSDPTRRKSRRVLIAAAIALVLALAVGGGAVAYNNHQEQMARQAVAEKAAAAERAKQQTEAARAEAKAACEAETSEALESLRGIQNIVDVGVRYSEYNELVLKAARSVGSLDTQLDPACQSVVKNLEKAFRQYGKASNTWNDYIYNDVGTTDQLQGPWAMADLYLTDAEATLSEWQPDSST